MATHRLLLLPGDGIGPEVMREVEKIVGWFRKRGVGFETETDLVGGSVVSRTTGSGEREAVKLASSGRIIVVGGGPIGLMSAIEASSARARCTPAAIKVCAPPAWSRCSTLPAASS